MSTFMTRLLFTAGARFTPSEEGQTMAEYALVLAFVATAAVTAFTFFGGSILASLNATAAVVLGA